MDGRFVEATVPHAPFSLFISVAYNFSNHRNVAAVNLWEATRRHLKSACFIARSSSCFRFGIQTLLQLPLRRVLSHIYAWSGNSAVKAINLLLSKGVVESNIIFLNLIAVSHSDACFYQKIQLHFPCIIYHNSLPCRHPKEYMWFARNFQSSKLWHRRLMQHWMRIYVLFQGWESLGTVISAQTIRH